MRITMGTLAALLLLAGAGSAHAQAHQFEKPGSCDRTCLIRLADDYLAALVAHNPKAVPLAPSLKFVENTVPMKPGEGLWATASAAPMTFAIHVPDPVSRQIGFIGMLEENGKPIELGLRLKFENGAIVEAEHLVARSFQPGALDNLKTVRPGLLAEVPRNGRLPRELMLAIGMTYYDSIEQSSGDATLFGSDCERRENGLITAGGTGLGLDGLPRLGCHAQMDSRTFTYIDDIVLRRVWIADPVTGLVFGLSHFRQSMKDKEITVIDRDGKLVKRDMSRFGPFDLPAAHIFKIRDNRIHEIEAIGFTMPYMSKSGWTDFLR
ncbi:MAG TPA: hypothetical protein VHH11_04555 [Gammaproteobacteria bacterium]|nr:hypothetical protein [Gammaproteobacteria bacterium]